MAAFWVTRQQILLLSDAAFPSGSGPHVAGRKENRPAFRQGFHFVVQSISGMDGSTRGWLITTTLQLCISGIQDLFILHQIRLTPMSVSGTDGLPLQIVRKTGGGTSMEKSLSVPRRFSCRADGSWGKLSIFVSDASALKLSDMATDGRESSLWCVAAQGRPTVRST